MKSGFKRIGEKQVFDLRHQDKDRRKCFPEVPAADR